MRYFVGGACATAGIGYIATQAVRSWWLRWTGQGELEQLRQQLAEMKLKGSDAGSDSGAATAAAPSGSPGASWA